MLPITGRNIEKLQEITNRETDDVVAHMQTVAAHPDQCRRYFAVGFRGAADRVPTYGDPLSYEQQIVEEEVEEMAMTCGRCVGRDRSRCLNRRTE